MLNNPHFYHQITRKSVILFGRLFDKIFIIDKNSSNQEHKRLLVPIIYSPKEKMVSRLISDPDLYKQVQVTLPRMGFEITDISYDATRKQNSLLKIAKSKSTTDVASAYMAVPYDLKFNLNIYARLIDDGTEIVEQILPLFNPDFTVTANMVPDLGVLKDIAIILNSVTNNIEYEGNFDSVRYVNWTLTFTMKTWYYGPVTETKLIRDVIVNMMNDSTLSPGSSLVINTTQDSNVKFKMDDVVFQGNNYHTSNARGIVLNYRPPTEWMKGKLIITSTQGHFKQGQTIHAVSTNASCVIDSFMVKPEQFVKIQIKPDPLNAMPTDDYGYDVNITEGYENIYVETQNNAEFHANADSTLLTVDSTTITTDID